jgi:hypothetical protein
MNEEEEKEVETNSKVEEIKTGSIVSLILGIIGLFIYPIICGICAILFGIGKSDGVAKAGIALGVIDIVLIAIIACIAL